MISKYTRELFMRGFNLFWRRAQPDVKPTAGYVQDARRFLRDTQATRRRLAVRDALLVRAR